MNDNDRLTILRRYLKKSRLDYAFNYLDHLRRSSLLGPKTAAFAISLYAKQKFWLKVIATFEAIESWEPNLPFESYIHACNAYISVGALQEASIAIQYAELIDPISESIVSRQIALTRGTGIDTYFHRHLATIDHKPPLVRSLLVGYSKLMFDTFKPHDPCAVFRRHSSIILDDMRLAGLFCAYFFDRAKYSLLKLAILRIFHSIRTDFHGTDYYLEKYRFLFEGLDRVESAKLIDCKEHLCLDSDHAELWQDSASSLLHQLIDLELNRRARCKNSVQYKGTASSEQDCNSFSIVNSQNISRSALSRIFEALSNDSEFFKCCNPASAVYVLQRFIRYKCRTSIVLNRLPRAYKIGCLYALLLSDWLTYYPLRFWVRTLRKEKSLLFTIEINELRVQLGNKSRSAQDEISQAWPLMLVSLLEKNNMQYSIILPDSLRKSSSNIRFTVFPPSVIINTADMSALQIIRRARELGYKLDIESDRRFDAVTLLSRIRHIDQLALSNSRLVQGISPYLDRNGNRIVKTIDIDVQKDICITPTDHPPVLSFSLRIKDSSINSSFCRSAGGYIIDTSHTHSADFLTLIDRYLHKSLISILDNARLIISSENIKEVNIGEGFCIESQALLQASAETDKCHATMWPHSINPSFFSFLYSDFQIDRFGVCTRSGQKHVESFLRRMKKPPMTFLCQSTLAAGSDILRVYRPSEPLSVIIIGNDTHSALTPFALISKIREATFRVTSGLRDKQGIEVYYKPKHNASSSVQAFARLVHPDLRFNVVNSKLTDICLPNPVFISIGVVSNALLEGIALGIPSLAVDPQCALQYVIAAPDLMLGISSEDVADEISRLKDPCRYSDLQGKQSHLLKQDYFG